MAALAEERCGGAGRPLVLFGVQLALDAA